MAKVSEVPDSRGEESTIGNTVNGSNVVVIPDFGEVEENENAAVRLMNKCNNDSQPDYYTPIRDK
jgi:hypothetical protein